jgi:hypothetical protein
LSGLAASAGDRPQLALAVDAASAAEGWLIYS